MKRSTWLTTGDGGNNNRPDFDYGTCTTVVIGDSDNYNSGTFDVILVKYFKFIL